MDLSPKQTLTFLVRRLLFTKNTSAQSLAAGTWWPCLAWPYGAAGGSRRVIGTLQSGFFRRADRAKGDRYSRDFYERRSLLHE